jgi:hypothetical protein
MQVPSRERLDRRGLRSVSWAAASMSNSPRRQTSDRPRSVAESSADNVLTVRISARPGGIAVQRTEQRPDGRRVVQSMHFADEASYVRWCQSDDLWFAYPLLFSKLSRSGCELFNSEP